MVEAAEQRKTAERHHFAVTLAIAFNEPKRVDEVAPPPKKPEAARAEKQQFVEEQWW
jgi:hypothetical protein